MKEEEEIMSFFFTRARDKKLEKKENTWG